VNLDTYDSPDGLYSARGGEVNPNRPVFTGDVFRDVAIPGVQAEGMALVVAHPCSFRVGEGQLAERLLAARVEPTAKQGPNAWRNGFLDRMPLTDLDGTGYWVGHLASSTSRCNGPAMMAGSPRSNNQWRLKHARHSAVGGRARGDSDRTGGRRRVRGARAGARTSDLHDLKRGRPKRWPARLPSDRRRPAGGEQAPSSEVDALPGEPRPRRPRRGTSDRPRLADHDRDRARTSRWDRRAHRVSRDD
jgi:hypothetical protein